MEIEHWDKARGELNEQNMRKRLESEGYRVNRYDYTPGTYFPDHTHSFDKKDAVLRGRFLICALDREFLLGPGDSIPVPAGTIHSAEVIGDETVVSLDASRY